MDCIFCKIRDKVISKDFIYEDKDVMVFEDIHPIKPIHLLIVTKKHISEFLTISDNLLFEKILKVIQKMIKEKLNNQGYRIVINGGGAQIVNHLHVHLVGPIEKEAKL